MNQRTSQNDPFQMLLGLINSQFKNEMKQYTQNETEKQKDSNDEKNNTDEQEEKKENQIGEADLFDKKEQREIENHLANQMSYYSNFFQTVKEQMKNENNQIPQNQLRHQFIYELVQECFDLLSQPQTQQMNFEQCIFNLLLSIQQKKQKLDQAQILTPPESDRNETVKQLREICTIVDKTIEKQEDLDIHVQEKPSQQLSMGNSGQDATTSECQQTSSKGYRELDTELTIKKGDKYQEKNIKQKNTQQVSKNQDDYLKQNINNSDNNIIYSYNDQFFSNQRDFYKCQIAFNQIQIHYIHIMSQLSKWAEFCQKLSFKIDFSGYMNNPYQFLMNFQNSFAQAIIEQLNSQNQYKIDLTMTQEIFNWLDMIIKMCNIYQIEVQKKQANNEQENVKELLEFQKLLQENEKEFIQFQQKYNEVLPMTNEKIESIQNKNEKIKIDKELLKVINKQIQEMNFYFDSFEANGGEAYILKGYFFKKDEKKQQCIFRCIKTTDEDKLKQIQEECDLVRSIQQPKNIIQYFDTLKIENSVIFIVEECKNSLKEEIQKMKENNKIEEFKLCQIMFDLIEGLIELRIHKIVHGDIKPDNILISQNGYCVYSDLGIACILEDEEEGVEAKGYSPQYSPFEQQQENGRMVYKSDIYSLGKTIINLINRLDQITCTEQTKQIMTNFKELAEKYMIQEYFIERLDCLQIFEKFLEIIFSKDYQSFQSFLKLYLQKVELIIISNNFEFSQKLKDLKNFDYEYYKQVQYTYCILYIRITFFIKGVKINNSQIEENIQNNSFDEHDVYNKQIAIAILKLGDYYREQNDDQKALQYYKQSFIFQKNLEINNLIDHTFDKIISSFTQLSKMNECLEYSLEQNELCEVIFKNVMKSYFDKNIYQICYNLKKGNDLQNLIKGLDSLNQYQFLNSEVKYKKYFFEEFIMFLRQIIEIYKNRNDNNNQLKYYIDLYQTIVEYSPNCDDYELQELIEDIIKLHDLCQQDYSHFIIEQVKKLKGTTSDNNKKMLYMLHTYLSKYYYEKSNMESSLEQFEKALKINKSDLKVNLQEQSDIEQFMKKIQIELNENNTSIIIKQENINNSIYKQQLHIQKCCLTIYLSRI